MVWPRPSGADRCPALPLPVPLVLFPSASLPSGFFGGVCMAAEDTAAGAPAPEFEPVPASTAAPAAPLLPPGCRMYVLQVPGGRERTACELAGRLLRPHARECFVPASSCMQRRRGAWHTVERLLFPGYVFVTTDDIAAVARGLARLPFRAHVVGGTGERFVPLTDEEVAWLLTLANVKTHVVEMSVGVIEGDHVVVWTGPLKGREADIVRIDRHKRTAELAMRMFGRTKHVRVGLEIVSKRGVDGSAATRAEPGEDM